MEHGVEGRERSTRTHSERKENCGGGDGGADGSEGGGDDDEVEGSRQGGRKVGKRADMFTKEGEQEERTENNGDGGENKESRVATDTAEGRTTRKKVKTRKK